MKYFRLNQTVYHSDYGQGKVVALEDPEDLEDVYSIEVEFVSHTVCFTEDGRKYDEYPISLSQNPIPEIVNKPIEDTYVPFTFEDDLLGKTVISKDKSCKGVITYQDERKIVIGNYNETYEVLLKDYTFIDGKPCGKLAN
jgi:hypothetical protein